MVTTHNLGFPRIGAHREMKFALETFWNGQSSIETLDKVAAQLRARHWQEQSGLDLIPVGDFSLYDHVLDMIVTLGNLPRARAVSMMTPYTPISVPHGGDPQKVRKGTLPPVK